MIRARNITRVHQLGSQEIRALDGVDLDVAEGEYLGLVGASGSGKTTLLNLLAGMDRPTTGTIETGEGALEGLDPEGLARYRRDRVAMVFQSFHLLPHRTALKNVETALLFSPVSPTERTKRSRAVLERLGLGERLNHRPPDLSGGEQQRVALARALVKRPEMLLADEPTGNLDRDNAHQIADLLVENNERGLTVILVTHDLDLAIRSAHRVIRLEYGRVIEEIPGQRVGTFGTRVGDTAQDAPPTEADDHGEDAP